MNEVAVRFLGSGDAFGSGGRFQTCIHVRSATMGFLIDCGASSLVAMKRFGVDPAGISRDPEVVQRRGQDPLVHGKITPRLYFGLEEARVRVLAEARRLQVPTLILQGAADRVVNPQGSLELTGLAPHGIARLITYRDGYHEVFNDLDRDNVIRDLAGWIDAILVV